MGVYIPNEDMPKDCYTCFCYETEFNMCSLTGKRLGDIRIRQDDCPLIEIVRCGECKHYNGHEQYCEIDHFARENGFCSSGKRRTDETIESITFKKMVKAVKEEMREVQNFAERRNDGTVCSYGVPANADQHTQRVESVGERRSDETN